jgi:hypothetical protein
MPDRSTPAGRFGPAVGAGAGSLAGRPRSPGADTLLTGCLSDQAAVYGVIARPEALGLDLLELRRLPG